MEIGSTTGEPVRTAVLRSIPLAAMIAEKRAELPPLPLPPRPAPTLSTMRPSTAQRLQLAAETYLEAWRVGEPTTQAVARRLNVSESAALNLVHRARAAGLLGETSPGMPKG